jgi:type IV secretion system protein VirB9
MRCFFSSASFSPHTLIAFTFALAAMAGPAGAQTRAARAETPAQVVAGANMAARQRPARDGFIEARHIYRYAPGAIYELYANPNYVSTMLLEPGETLEDIAAGDTSRWLVTQAESEGEGERRTIILVKPNSGNLRTNIVVITDRRTYLIEAQAHVGAVYSAQIAWNYPARETDAVTSPGEALNFNFRIRLMRGRRPAWTPVRVFDDGRRTWLEFSERAAASDLPPLFVISGEGAELVNYRVIESRSGPRYVVDRIFDVGELRLGVRSPVIVRIERASMHEGRRSAIRSEAHE